MLQSIEEIYVAVITTAILMVLLVVIILIAIVKYQGRLRKHFQEMNDLKNLFQQELLKAQLEMKEQTLHTISQEIHDNIGQILSLVKLHLNTVPLEQGSPAGEKIAASRELVGKAIQDLRSLSKKLHTEHVSQQLLSASLQFELDLMQKTGLYETHLRVSGAEKALDPQKQLIVFRIAQEALHNIIKHARARRIGVELRYLPGRLEMSIEDDGAGFDPAALLAPDRPDRGTGLRNMHHRARLIGAHFALDSLPGQGTRTRLSLPTPNP